MITDKRCIRIAVSAIVVSIIVIIATGFNSQGADKLIEVDNILAEDMHRADTQSYAKQVRKKTQDVSLKTQEASAAVQATSKLDSLQPEIDKITNQTTTAKAPERAGGETSAAETAKTETKKAKAKKKSEEKETTKKTSKKTKKKTSKKTKKQNKGKQKENGTKKAVELGRKNAAEVYSSVYKNVTKNDFNNLCRIVEAEAGNQGAEGKLLVADVILNRVNSSKFPGTISDVIFQQGQFQPMWDGNFYRVNVSDETVSSVKRALAGEDQSQGALYFACQTSAGSFFNMKLSLLFVYKSHYFYK